MKKLFLFLLNLLVCGISYGQKDFRPGYILQNGDTVKGYVDYRSDNRNANLCVFKNSLTAPERQIKPGEIDGYGYFESRRYESKLIPVEGSATGTPRFVKILVKGTASLFVYQNFGKTDQYFLQKGLTFKLLEEIVRQETRPNGTKIKVREKPYEKVLAENFQDCPALAKDISETSLKNSSLMELFVKYNNCNPPPSLSFVHKPVKNKFTWGVVAGANASTLTIAGDTYLQIPKNYPGGITPHGGLFMNLILPRLNEKLSLLVEGIITQNKYQAEFVEKGNFGRENNYKVNFDLTYINFPVQFRYTYPKGDFRPFINAGVVNAFCLKCEQEASKYSIFNNSGYTETSEPLRGFRTYIQGLTGGLGVMQAKSNFPMVLELRYFTSNGFSKATTISTTINTYFLTFGLVL